MDFAAQGHSAGVTSRFPAGRWDGLWLELGCSQREELEQVGEGGEPEVVLSSVGQQSKEDPN